MLDRTRGRTLTTSAITVLAFAGYALAAAPVRFDEQAGHLVVSIGERAVASYVYKDRTISRPFLAHVSTQEGTQLTRNHPPKKDDLQDHATMHPGIWLAFGDLSGHDYWRLKAKVVHDGFVEKPASTEGRGGFAVQNRYLSADGKTPICTELCRISFLVRPRGYLVFWDSTFSSESGDFSFGDQEEMGLGVRLATPLAVVSKRGGRIRDDAGRQDERGIWGKEAAWCDYSGPLDGRQSGITLMADPNNFRPCWWHVRDYGLMVANPFGRQALTRGEKSTVTVRRGDSLRLRFGIYVHSAADAAEPNPPGAAYRDFVATLGKDDEEAKEDVLKYVRPAKAGFADETEVRVRKEEDGYVITSITQRPNTKLTLTSRFDAKDRLVEAKVVVDDGKTSTSATAKVTGGSVRVERDKGDARSFDCPAGVIVTSAPDWTDAILAVRRYDPKGKATQEFPGLWIHPTQEPQRLTFKLTRQGESAVSHKDRKVTLTRFLLELRGGSRYTLYGNPQGRLVRLSPEGKPKQSILLSGWEDLELPSDK
jgi:hypothetical protein